MVAQDDDRPPRRFGSDNQAGAHPRVLAALAAVNPGHVGGYGADPSTAELSEILIRHFGPGARGVPVFSGTGANIVALGALADRWTGVLCAASAHITTAEGGGPEQATGVKLIELATPEGKLTPEAVARALDEPASVHHSRPAVVSLTQPTELGTVYTPAELAAVVAAAHAGGARVHLDGARLANAAAALGETLGAVSTDTGADVVCLGGTKNGLAFGEVIVARDPDLVARLVRARKGLGQLGSKQRFLSAQLVELYGGELWSTLAATANQRAGELAAGLAGLPGIEIAYPVEANLVLVRTATAVGAVLRDRYAAQPVADLLRLVCSWDTTTDDVHGLLRDVAAARDESTLSVRTDR
jgi:threonine aldolase